MKYFVNGPPCVPLLPEAPLRPPRRVPGATLPLAPRPKFEYNLFLAEDGLTLIEFSIKNIISHWPSLTFQWKKLMLMDSNWQSNENFETHGFSLTLIWKHSVSWILIDFERRTLILIGSLGFPGGHHGIPRGGTHGTLGLGDQVPIRRSPGGSLWIRANEKFYESSNYTRYI